MNEYSTAVLNGKIDAISLVLNQVLIQLTPAQAARAALGLAIEKETVRNEVDYSTPEAEISATEQFLDLYVDLLSTVAQRE